MIGAIAEHDPGGSMHKRVLGAAAIVALLAGPALAQQKSIPQYGDLGKAKTQSEIDEDKAPVDPWGNARTVGEPKAVKADAKAAAKTDVKTAPAKPKAKAGEMAK
jgi:hypothetical protein